MNKQRFLDAIERLKTDKSMTFDMDTGIAYIPKNIIYGPFTDQTLEAAIEDPCGTTCCIAGDAVIQMYREGMCDTSESLFANAETWFDITHEQAISLFYSCQWPPTLECRYEKAKTQKGRRSAAAAAIKYFMGKWKYV